MDHMYLRMQYLFSIDCNPSNDQIFDNCGHKCLYVQCWQLAFIVLPKFHRTNLQPPTSNLRDSTYATLWLPPQCLHPFTRDASCYLTSNSLSTSSITPNLQCQLRMSTRQQLCQHFGLDWIMLEFITNYLCKTVLSDFIYLFIFL